jgi:chromosome segregation ATPase
MIKTYDEHQGSTDAPDKELEELQLDLANQEWRLESLQSNIVKEVEEKDRAIEEAEQKLVQGTEDLNTQIEDLKALHKKTLEEKTALLESLDGCEATISSLQEELKKLQKESLAEKEKIKYDEDMAQIASQLKEELKDIKSNHDILQKEIESLTTERRKLQELNMTQKETISKLVENFQMITTIML